MVIPERDILKSSLARLAVWKMYKVVIHYERRQVRSLDHRHIRTAHNGHPDIDCYVKWGNICAICFFEIKRSHGGKQSQSQLEFMLKFKDLTNVFYDIITDPDQIDHRIESITGYYSNQLSKMGDDL